MKKKKRVRKDKKQVIVLATGGTGGHVFPAISLAKDLEKTVEPVFVGVGLTKNQFLKNVEWKKIEIKGNFSNRGFYKWPFSVVLGCFKSIWFYRSHKVSCVVGFGSFYSFPAMLAAFLLRIPYLIYEPNRITGKVNRLFSPWARENCVFFTDVDMRIKGKKRLIRLDKKLVDKTSDEIRELLQFSKEKKTLFVMGGSGGSSFLNRNVSCLELDAQKYQLIHMVGQEAELEEVRGNYRKRSIDAVVMVFSDKTHYFWSIADLFIGSSGATTIGESIIYNVAAIWVPLSYSSDNHQLENAFYAERVIGSGQIVEEKQFEPLKFVHMIDLLFESGKIEKYREQIKRYNGKNRREKLSEIVLEYNK